VAVGSGGVLEEVEASSAGGVGVPAGEEDPVVAGLLGWDENIEALSIGRENRAWVID